MLHDPALGHVLEALPNSKPTEARLDELAWRARARSRLEDRAPSLRLRSDDELMRLPAERQRRLRCPSDDRTAHYLGSSGPRATPVLGRLGVDDIRDLHSDEPDDSAWMMLSSRSARPAVAESHK